MAATAAAVERGRLGRGPRGRQPDRRQRVHSNGYLAFVHDDQESFFADAFAPSRLAARRYALVWDASAIRQFAAESAETHRILTSRGCAFQPHRVPARAQRRPHLCRRGARPCSPAPTPTTSKTLAVRSMFGVRVRSAPHRGGRVTGRQSRTASTTAPGSRSRARRRGVVLATGGYQAGHPLRQRYQAGGAARSRRTSALPNCRGDGHVIGAAVGADLVNMSYLPPMVLAPSTVVENAIAVNAAGARFHDETGSFDDRVTMLRAAGGPARLVHPRRGCGARSQARLIEQMPQPPVPRPPSADLAAAIAVPAERLTRPSSSGTASWPPAPQTDPEFGRTALPRGRRGLKAGAVHRGADGRGRQLLLRRLPHHGADAGDRRVRQRRCRVSTRPGTPPPGSMRLPAWPACTSAERSPRAASPAAQPPTPTGPRRLRQRADRVARWSTSRRRSLRSPRTEAAVKHPTN